MVTSTLNGEGSGVIDGCVLMCQVCSLPIKPVVVPMGLRVVVGGGRDDPVAPVVVGPDPVLLGCPAVVEGAVVFGVSGVRLVDVLSVLVCMVEVVVAGVPRS